MEYAQKLFPPPKNKHKNNPPFDFSEMPILIHETEVLQLGFLGILRPVPRFSSPGRSKLAGCSYHGCQGMSFSIFVHSGGFLLCECISNIEHLIIYSQKIF